MQNYINVVQSERIAKKESGIIRVEIVKRRRCSMPYGSINELPENVRNVLPKHAQEIYKEAFNSALDQYDRPEERRGDEGREEVAHKVAWGAVKRAGYKKGSDDNWHNS